MHRSDFYYLLPPGLIAQHPLPERDQSRLLVLSRPTALLEHRYFFDLPEYLKKEDILVVNNSKVIPARLRGIKEQGGANVEVFLVEEVAENLWWVLLKPGKRVQKGTSLLIKSRSKDISYSGIVQEKSGAGEYLIQFSGPGDIRATLADLGEVPLPPYILRQKGKLNNQDAERYQTLFAGPEGSVAAPTAGLHFSSRMLQRIREKGIELVEVTLHVGLGTFMPIKLDEVEKHLMHQEHYEITAGAAEKIQRAKMQGGRVFAVGTTSLRGLETVARKFGKLTGSVGKTDLFVYPPYHFKVVDALLTNFHLPESTLLMLVSAFAAPGATSGRELILKAYAEAIAHRYRFFSYGDAMLIL